MIDNTHCYTQELAQLTELICDGDLKETKEMITFLLTEVKRFENQHLEGEGVHDTEAHLISSDMHKLAGAGALMYLNYFSKVAQNFEDSLQNIDVVPAGDCQLMFHELRKVLVGYLSMID